MRELVIFISFCLAGLPDDGLLLFLWIVGGSNDDPVFTNFGKLALMVISFKRGLFFRFGLRFLLGFHFEELLQSMLPFAELIHGRFWE